jgi:hypothetical protein
MYDLLKTTSFPVFASTAPLPPGAQPLAIPIMNALKEVLADFKCFVYISDQPTLLSAYLVQLRKLTSTQLTLSFEVRFSSQVAAVIDFDLSSNDEYYRVYFSTEDATLSEGTDPNAVLPVFEGYIVVNKVIDFLNKIPTVAYAGLQVPLEPGCLAIVTRHRVNQLQCQYAKPLFVQSTQPTESNYTDLSAPLTDHVQLKPGLNCTITLQPALNSILISAQKNANDSPEETCGVWADPVSPNDVLCSQGIYAISGVAPDSSGNVNIKAELPMVCSIISRPNVPAAFQGAVSSYNYVDNFIYVGLPETADNPSVFNCT